MSFAAPPFAPPIRTKSSDTDAISIISKASRSTNSSSLTKVQSLSAEDDAVRKLWCETQWVNLSRQARELGLPSQPWFVRETGLLSKEVSGGLWQSIIKLYGILGPEQAPYALPKMIEGGEVKWYSYLGEARGVEAEIYESGKHAGWSHKSDGDQINFRGMRSAQRGPDMRGFDPENLKTKKGVTSDRTVGASVRDWSGH